MVAQPARRHRRSISHGEKSDLSPTQLQASYAVGTQEVAPFISVQEVLDHVTFLHHVYSQTRRMSPEQYRKFCRLSATDYQIWAQRCLPARERALAREQRRASRQSNLSAPPSSYSPALERPPMSRTHSHASTSRSSINTADDSMPATPPDAPIHPMDKAARLASEALTPTTSQDSAGAFPTGTLSPPHSAPIRPVTSETSSLSSFEHYYDRYVGPLSPLTKHELPPLGALMCWHAHMSSPQNYDQECEGAYRTLRGWRFPIHEVAQAIREGLLPRKLELPNDNYKGSLQTTNWDPYTIAIATERSHSFIFNLAHSTSWFDRKHTSTEGAMETHAVEAVEKYFMFLNLHHMMLTRRPRIHLAPTSDIDLVWQTHQLHGQTYRLDIEGVLGKALDHDEHMKLVRNEFGQDWLGRTSKLWWATYREVYTAERKDPRPLWRRLMDK